MSSQTGTVHPTSLRYPDKVTFQLYGFHAAELVTTLLPGCPMIGTRVDFVVYPYFSRPESKTKHVLIVASTVEGTTLSTQLVQVSSCSRYRIGCGLCVGVDMFHALNPLEASGIFNVSCSLKRLETA